MRAGEHSSIERGEGTLTLRRRGDDNLYIATWVFAGFTVLLAGGTPFLPGGAVLIPLVLLGVYGFVLSLNWGTRLGGGVLRSVTKTLDVRPAPGAGYRDATGRVLVIDGVSFDAARVREVSVRRFTPGKGEPIYAVWIVLDELAFRVDQSTEVAQMNAITFGLRETLEVRGGFQDEKRENAPGGGAWLLLLVLEFPAMVPGFWPGLHWVEKTSLVLMAGPLEIAGVTILFALLFRYLRDPERERARVRSSGSTRAPKAMSANPSSAGKDGLLLGARCAGRAARADAIVRRCERLTTSVGRSRVRIRYAVVVVIVGERFCARRYPCFRWPRS